MNDQHHDQYDDDQVDDPHGPHRSHRPNVGPVGWLVATTDLEQYGAPTRTAAHRRDLRDRLLDAEQRAARDCGLTWPAAFVQSQGDGDLLAWRAGALDVTFVARFPAVLAQELADLNAARQQGHQIRVRMALATGVSEITGATMNGEAAITARALIDSDPIRAAMDRTGGCSLVLVVDESLYRSVVQQGFGGLRPDRFAEVRFADKRGQLRRAWITVPEAGPDTLALLHQSFTRPEADMNNIDKLLDALAAAASAGAVAGTADITSSWVTSAYADLKKRLVAVLATQTPNQAQDGAALVNRFEREPAAGRRELARSLRVSGIEDDDVITHLLSSLTRALEALEERPPAAANSYGGNTFTNSNGNVVGSGNHIDNSTRSHPGWRSR